MATNFDDIFNAAKQPEQPETKKPADELQSTPKPLLPKSAPWAELEPEEKEPTIRLNVDIPVGLNDKLSERAYSYRKSKSELVRMLLVWALEN